MIEILRSVLLGIVEGITEWLPISSTGHMILVNELIGNNGFTSTDLYLYVIQLGAILAVVTMYFKRLNPFALSKSPTQKRATRQMWFKVVVACVPAAVFGLALDGFMERLEVWQVVAATLFIYGVAFIVVESRKREAKINSLDEMSYKTALCIGLFQVLSIVPGTSRSGATILGASLVGTSRELAAEFSFFLAIPVMFGVSFLKLVSNYELITRDNILILLIGMAVAYAVSMLSMKFLVQYVKKHDFKAFGVYRIVLAVLVTVFFAIKTLTAA